MVLPGVHLPFRPRYDRSIRADNDEQVLCVESDTLVLVDDFHVGQTLRVGADLILAFDDENSIGLEHSMSLPPGAKVKIKNSRMVLWTTDRFFAVGIVLPESRVRSRACQVSR